LERFIARSLERYGPFCNPHVTLKLKYQGERLLAERTVMTTSFTEIKLQQNTNTEPGVVTTGFK